MFPFLLSFLACIFRLSIKSADHVNLSSGLMHGQVHLATQQGYKQLKVLPVLSPFTQKKLALLATKLPKCKTLAAIHFTAC